MAKVKTVGFEVLDFGQYKPEHIDRIVYEGARVMADEVRKNIEALPVRKPHEADGSRGVTPQEKQALLDGLGVARIQNKDGTWDTHIGFEGYDSVKTKKYPQGHPISMIARTVEKGASWLQKTPFIAPAVKSKSSVAEAAMAAELEKQITKN